jgi:hypothetical protein
MAEGKTNPNLEKILENLKFADHYVGKAQDVTKKVNDGQGTKKLQERRDSIQKDIEEFKSRGK